MKTPRGERLHIGIFGKRNAGKSSLLNALIGQNFAVVSAEKGTTTDPVYKSMELLPVGPVVFIDTAGIDDSGEVGELRIKKTRNILRKVDFAILVIDATEGITAEDTELRREFEASGINFLTVYNKADIVPDSPEVSLPRHDFRAHTLYASAKTGAGINELKEKIAEMNATAREESPLVSDLISPGDTVVLVVPIDDAAPKGRIILPQQQVLREILDVGAIAIVCRETEYPAIPFDVSIANDLENSEGEAENRGLQRVFRRRPNGLLKYVRDNLRDEKCVESHTHTPPRNPALVITDSQVFRQIAAATPPEIPLTSFSILMARRKGALAEAVRGAHALDKIANGDTILIAEACTHHRQCGDIATVKLPRLIEAHSARQARIEHRGHMSASAHSLEAGCSFVCNEKTGARPAYEFTSGGEFPEDLSKYSLIIHCGACMLNRREMLFRQNAAVQAGVPITNFGIAISCMTGILERAVECFEV
ncbi:MAG: GTP-binding protein [Defluviitaleaceae bacterium]|nr:GTP-binding protein [Defluviitaleaceae bacterium]